MIHYHSKILVCTQFILTKTLLLEHLQRAWMLQTPQAWTNSYSIPSKNSIPNKYSIPHKYSIPNKYSKPNKYSIPNKWHAMYLEVKFKVMCHLTVIFKSLFRKLENKKSTVRCLNKRHGSHCELIFVFVIQVCQGIYL